MMYYPYITQTFYKNKFYGNMEQAYGAQVSRKTCVLSARKELKYNRWLNKTKFNQTLAKLTLKHDLEHVDSRQVVSPHRFYDFSLNKTHPENKKNQCLDT